MKHTSLLPSLSRATRLAAALATATLALWQPAAQAQPADDFPNKPVKLIVPFSPGGSTDVIARIVQQKLGAALGLRAGTMVHMQRVAAAAPTCARRPVCTCPYVCMLLCHALLRARPTSTCGKPRAGPSRCCR
jgi:hypothetical protein